MIYFPDKLSFLEGRILMKIGISSYFLYLIHEHLGVFLINRFGHDVRNFVFLIPLSVIFILILFSVWYFYFLEIKISKILKRLILFPKK
jgi:peptidoglycan/LPS O-acetylase OafA/YrhL